MYNLEFFFEITDNIKSLCRNSQEPSNMITWGSIPNTMAVDVTSAFPRKATNRCAPLLSDYHNDL